MEKSQSIDIINTLSKMYGEHRSYVEWDNDPLRLLIGTVLAAQERDNTVNRVLDRCWHKYNTCGKIVAAGVASLLEDFQEIGMHDVKAPRVYNIAVHLSADFKGKVPNDFNYLISLPGVGRKTASIVLLYAFNSCPYVAVDTHVKRLSQRIGIATKRTPDAISNEYQSFPESVKKKVNFALVSHGKQICTARNPRCESCSISDLCEKNGVR